MLTRVLANVLDWGMCAGMYAIQRRHRLHEGSRAELERYMEECEGLRRPEFFAGPEPLGVAQTDGVLAWESPVRTRFPANDRAHVRLFPCERGWSAPTVLFLHALMSASDVGYRRWAARFNERRWNACFVHLPFHYSRTPPGHRNGELAITADLVRTAEAIRQGVAELRQLMAVLRARGVRDFALWAISYGGWVGAVLASVEELRFAAIMEPIVDLSHAVWESPAGLAVRRQCSSRGITRELVERHFHLSSPLHAQPFSDPSHILLIAGTHDRIAPRSEIARLHQTWRGSEMVEIPQGHFGYGMMRRAWQWAREREFV